jgi:DNA-binding IclR family transcriptional regulator
MKSTVLVKAFRLLETLGGQQGEFRLGELASATCLAKPTAHRILNDLVDLGYVERTPSAAYRVTDKLQHLSLAVDDRSLISAADPVLAELQAITRETVNLAVLRGHGVVYLRVWESSHPLRRVTVPQGSDPFHSTALGRVIAAHLSPAQQDHLLEDRPLEKRTPHTVTDPVALRQMLHEAHRNGFCIEKHQSEVGVMCVAAPIRRGTSVIGAISISAPCARVDARTEREFVRQVRDGAARIEQALNRKDTAEV